MFMDSNGFFTVGEMFWQGHSVEDSKETMSSLKEPVGAILLEEPLMFAKHLIESTNQELLPGKKANRVLSEITNS